MRGTRWIAAGMTALYLLGGTAEAAKRKPAPSNFSKALSPVPTTPYNALLTTGPITTTLEQKWPHAQPVVTVEGIDEIVEHYRRLFTVVRSDQVLLSDNEFRPIAVLTLPKEGKRYKEWMDAERKGDDGRQRVIMQQAARDFKNDIERLLKQRGMKRDDMRTNVGMADDFVKGLTRYAEYAPYFEQMFAEFGLDPLLARDAINESNMIFHDVSYANCYGIYQIGDEEAKQLGMIIPPTKTPRKNRKSMVDERFHPLLNAQGAAQIFLAYSLHSGSLPDGIEAFHSGPGNKAKMRLLALKYPQVTKAPPKDVASVLEQYVESKGEEWNAEKLSVTIDVVAKAEPLSDRHSLSQLTWRIRNSNIPQNDSGYKEQSRRYLPAFFANLSAAQQLPTVPQYQAELVRVLYNDDDNSYERNYSRHNKDGKPYRVKSGKRVRKTQTYLTGADVAKLFPDMMTFRKHNPHIPLDARIPRTAHVDLLPGMSQKFFSTFPELQPTKAITYTNGKIVGLQAPKYTRTDLDFIRQVTNQRFEGKYHRVTEEMMNSYLETFKELYRNEPTTFRAFMQHMASFDYEMYANKKVFKQFHEMLKLSAKADNESNGASEPAGN